MVERYAETTMYPGEGKGRRDREREKGSKGEREKERDATRLAGRKELAVP